MKTIKTIIILLTLILVISGLAYPQMDNFSKGDCPITDITSSLPKPFKPVATGSSFFRVILVYVMFDDETQDSNNSVWPANTTNGPSFKGTMLAQQKNTATDWWNAYSPSTQSISSWFCEVSKGTMHVIGDEYFVKLDHDVSYYQVSGRGESEVNKDIYAKLSAISGFSWSDYDNWEYHTNGQITSGGDDVIDMIYKIHRYKYTGIFSEDNSSGFAYLGVANNQIHYLVDPVNEKYVYGGFPEYFANETKGSGVSILGNSTSGVLTKGGVLGRIWHEHGHYTFGTGHGSIGIMGEVWDPFMNPFEHINVGYVSPHYSNTDYEELVLNDISGRSTGNPSLIRVQLTNSEILVSNRNKISTWDRPMMGDKAEGDFMKETDYGSGVYIYHISGLGLPSYTGQDIECADGLWNWEQDGFDAPDWDPTNEWLPVLKRTNPVRGVNDDGTGVNVNINSGTVKDGLTIRGYTINLPPNQTPNMESKWFSVGRKKTATVEGEDRIITNDEDNWTSRENQVDRWDAWSVNEIFSPYSSPSTTTWNGNNSGVFIWYKDFNSSSKQATIRIYRDISYYPNNGWDEEDILEATPPSKPMGIKIDRTVCEDYRRYPVLTWNHNMEPDMLQGYPSANYKRYKIYRAWNEVDYVPVNYIEIADTLIHKDDDPTYIDYNTYGQCDQGSVTINYRLRYKVKAVDNTDWASVYSDFVSMSSYYLNRGGDDGDNFTIGDENLPKKYDLSQNYPNPFNPVTRINYAIPKQGFVTLKIYDITGREIKVLVNEFRQAGYYTVDFNGSSLASGVYFYRIQSGAFISVKKMVLVK